MEVSSPNNSVARFLEWLTRPPKNLSDAAERNQSRLLSAIFLLLIPLGLFVIVVQRWAVSHEFASDDPYFMMEIAILICFLFGYFMNRVGFYLPAVVYSLLTLCVVIFLLTYSASASDGSERFLMYLVIPALVAFVFLALPAAIAFTIMLTFLAIGFTYMVPGMVLSKGLFMIFGYLVVIFMVIIILTYYRNELSKLRKMEIAEREARFRTIFERLPDVGFVVDIHSKVVKNVNRSITETLGYERESIPGTRLTGMIPKDEIRKDLLIDIARGRDVGTIDILRMDGSRCPMEARGSMIPWGNEDAAIILLRDVTERAKARELLITEKNRAELYLDILGHDVNNQNQAVISVLGLNLLDGGLGPELRKDLQIALKQAWAISRLVRNVKHISELDSAPVEPVPTDVNASLEAAIGRMRKKNMHTMVKVTHSIRPGKVRVLANELLEEIFLNLLENSIKFNKNDVITVDIVHHRTVHGDWQIELTDNGIGVADEYKDRIFKRLRLEVKELLATGSGLALVDKAVTLWGGKVWVEDRVKGDHRKGSKFIIKLKKGE